MPAQRRACNYPVNKRETADVSDYTADDNPTIYIVDPDRTHCDSVMGLLERLGYRTATYPSAEDFLGSLASPALNGCVIAETHLPGMNGMELLAALRQRRIGMPLIILTSDPDVSGAVAALHHKVSDYLLKPVVERDLVTRVRDALRKFETSNRVNTAGG